jgi:hypothetical protein
VTKWAFGRCPASAAGLTRPPALPKVGKAAFLVSGGTLTLACERALEPDLGVWGHT